MPDDVKIPITTPGAQRAKRELTDVARAERGLGADARRAGKEAAQGKEKAAGWTDRLLGKLKALAAGYIGLRGAQLILASLTRETQALNEASRKAAESMRAILALSSLKGERKEVQKLVWDMAISSGRPVEQVAPAYYTLLGGTAGMAPERQRGLMRQALLTAKTDPAASLDALVNLFSTIASQQPQMTPTQISNLLSKTIEQAKSTSGEMAGYLPELLTTAKVAGVDIGTAAAMFSFGTRRGGGVAKSGTAVRAGLFGLLAPPPATLKELEAHGFPVQGDIMERVRWVGRQGAALPPELQTALGGREGIQFIAGIAAAPEEFARERGIISGALGAPGSLIAERLRSLYGEMPEQRIEDQIKQMKVIEQRQKQEPEVRLREAQYDFYRNMMREADWGVLRRSTAGWVAKMRKDLEMAPLPGGVDARFEAMMTFLEEGYEPGQLMEDVFPTLMEGGVGRRYGVEAAVMGEKEYTQIGRMIIEQQRLTPMGGTVNININEGCTQYINADRRDPAARPVEPVNQH